MHALAVAGVPSTTSAPRAQATKRDPTRRILTGPVAVIDLRIVLRDTFPRPSASRQDRIDDQADDAAQDVEVVDGKSPVRPTPATSHSRRPNAGGAKGGSK